MRLLRRAEQEALTRESIDLGDPLTWEAERDLLSTRASRAGAAERKAERQERAERVQTAGGILFGAAMLGAQWSVKEGLVPAELALGAPLGCTWWLSRRLHKQLLGMRSHASASPSQMHTHTTACAGVLALGAPLLSALGFLGNWRGEDVEWRAEQKRMREEGRL